MNPRDNNYIDYNHAQAPGILTLGWDSMKTSYVNRVTVATASFVEAIAGGGDSTIFRDEADSTLNSQPGCGVGVSILGVLSAFVFSAPLAIAAQHTRKFYSNEFIELKRKSILDFV